MFEMIGLLIGTAIFFGLAALAGAGLAFMTWFISGRGLFRRTFWTVGAFCFPIITAAYLLLCAALLPGESLFGDIEQPLPNGYFLTALGKMPGHGQVAHHKLAEAGAMSTEAYVRSITVEGPLVAGQYSHDFMNDQPDNRFFLLDTRDGMVRSFESKSGLQVAVGKPVTLVEYESFHSEEPEYLGQARRERWIEFGPPTLLLLLFAGALSVSRRRGWHRSDAAYT